MTRFLLNLRQIDDTPSNLDEMRFSDVAFGQVPLEDNEGLIGEGIGGTAPRRPSLRTARFLGSIGADLEPVDDNPSFRDMEGYVGV